MESGVVSRIIELSWRPPWASNRQCLSSSPSEFSTRDAIRACASGVRSGEGANDARGRATDVCILSRRGFHPAWQFARTCSCWEYALEAIIKWFISIFIFMIIVYSPCYNCIKRKHNTCVEYKHQESLVSLYMTSSLIKR